MKPIAASLFLFAILIPVVGIAQPDLTALDGVISDEEKKSMESIIENGKQQRLSGWFRLIGQNKYYVRAAVRSQPLPGYRK